MERAAVVWKSEEETVATDHRKIEEKKKICGQTTSSHRPSGTLEEPILHSLVREISGDSLISVECLIKVVVPIVQYVFLP